MLSQENPPISPRKALFEMLQSYVKPQLIYVAAKLGLADLLAAGPRPFDYLAERTEAEPQALQRLLRGLVNIGLLYNTDEAEFGLTELGQCLVSEADGSMRQVAILQGEEIFRAWGNLLYSVQTGKPAFEYALGVEFFDYFARHEDVAQRFNYFMSNTGGQAARALCAAYDFKDCRHLVDVGGGNGLLLTTALEANPHLEGTLFDVTANPSNVPPERCRVVQGDFFVEVPGDGDVYILSQIIHDWDDERARLILQNCRRVMESGTRLLLFEQIMPQPAQPLCPTVELDLVMLVLTGGRERTESEFRDLLTTSGFRLNRLIPTRHDRVIIEAIACP